MALSSKWRRWLLYHLVTLRNTPRHRWGLLSPCHTAPHAKNMSGRKRWEMCFACKRQDACCRCLHSKMSRPSHSSSGMITEAPVMPKSPIAAISTSRHALLAAADHSRRRLAGITCSSHRCHDMPRPHRPMPYASGLVTDLRPRL